VCLTPPTQTAAELFLSTTEEKKFEKYNKDGTFKGYKYTVKPTTTPATATYPDVVGVRLCIPKDAPSGTYTFEHGDASWTGVHAQWGAEHRFTLAQYVSPRHALPAIAAITEQLQEQIKRLSRTQFAS